MNTCRATFDLDAATLRVLLDAEPVTASILNSIPGKLVKTSSSIALGSWLMVSAWMVLRTIRERFVQSKS